METGYRILVAIDQFDAGRSALMFTAGMASRTGASVRIVHVVEHYPTRLGGPSTMESPEEASRLMEDAGIDLAHAGIDTSVSVRATGVEQVADTIADEATRWGAGIVVLGSRRLHGSRRVSGRGVRDKLIRAVDLPVVVAVPPVGDDDGTTRRARTHAGTRRNDA